MKKLLILVAVIICMPISSYALLGFNIEGAVGVWGSAPSGDFSYDSEFQYDMEDIFGFDSETFPMARVKLEIPVVPNIYLMATPMKFEGNAKESFEFEGITFTADSDTELTYNQYDIALYYGVPFLGLASLGMFHVDAGLNLRIVELEAKMTEHTTGATTDESVTLPIPMLYLAADLSPIDAITIEAEIRALPISDLELVSAIARVKGNLPGPFYISAGYRHESAVVDQDDFDFDVQFSGPFAEAGFSF